MWLGIHSIRCESTASMGYDDVFVHASVDGQPEFQLDRLTFMDGQVREIMREIFFSQNVTIRLSDVHYVNEEIGKVTYHASNALGLTWQPSFPVAIPQGGNGKYGVGAQVIGGDVNSLPASLADYVTRLAVEAWIASSLAVPPGGGVPTDTLTPRPWTGRIGSVETPITDPVLQARLLDFSQSSLVDLFGFGASAGNAPPQVSPNATFNSIAGCFAIVQQVIDRLGPRLRPGQVPTATEFPAVPRVLQGATNTCVQVSVMMEMILRFPWRYVAMCQRLLETGDLLYDVDSMDAMPTKVLARSNLPSSGISALDWMVASAMAESVEWDSDINSLKAFDGTSVLDAAELLEEQLAYNDVCNQYSWCLFCTPTTAKTNYNALTFEAAIQPIVDAGRSQATMSVLLCFRSTELLRVALNFINIIQGLQNGSSNTPLGSLALDPNALLFQNGMAIAATNWTGVMGFIAGFQQGQGGPFDNHCVSVYRATREVFTAAPDQCTALATLDFWTRGSMFRLTMRDCDWALCVRQVVMAR